MISNDELLEYERPYNGDYYGIPKTELGRQTGFAIFNLGIESTKFIGKSYDFPRIYILPENKEILRARMGNRGLYRYERAKTDIELIEEVYDFILINKTGKLSETVYNLYAIANKNPNPETIISNNHAFISTFFH